MTKFTFFLTILFVYLGLLQFFSPTEKQILDIKNSRELLTHLKGDFNSFMKHPSSIILADVYREGVFIRTSYVKLYLVSPFESKKTISYKVSSSYYHYLAPYIGHEILRHQTQRNPIAQNIFLPPGFSFVANPILGYWKDTNKGRRWFFYKYYEQLYKDLAWDSPKGSYRPRVETYRSLMKLGKKNDLFLLPGREQSFSRFKKTPRRSNLIVQESEFFAKPDRYLSYLVPLSLRRKEVRSLVGFMNFTLAYYEQLFNIDQSLGIGASK